MEEAPVTGLKAPRLPLCSRAARGFAVLSRLLGTPPAGLWAPRPSGWAAASLGLSRHPLSPFRLLDLWVWLWGLFSVRLRWLLCWLFMPVTPSASWMLPPRPLRASMVPASLQPVGPRSVASPLLLLLLSPPPPTSQALSGQGPAASQPSSLGTSTWVNVMSVVMALGPPRDKEHKSPAVPRTEQSAFRQCWKTRALEVSARGPERGWLWVGVGWMALEEES